MTPPFELIGAEPITVVPSIKVTVPVAFGLRAVTFAVKVTPVWSNCAGALSTIVVTVGILPTTCVRTADVAALYVESPPYDAVME